MNDHDTVIEQYKCRPRSPECKATINTGKRKGPSLPEHLRQILTQTHKRSEWRVPQAGPCNRVISADIAFANSARRSVSVIRRWSSAVIASVNEADVLFWSDRAF